MSSAGAQCDHMVHVSTQLYYAITCAIISFVTYLLVGFVPNPFVGLGVGVILTIGTIFVLHKKLSTVT